MRTHHNLSDSVANFIDRRVYIRVPVTSVAYIDLGQENGGLILNISEGGVAIHAAEIVEGATFGKMRFQLPNSDRWIEGGGKLVWHGHSKKKAGVEFVNLSDEARRQIRNWTDLADVRSDESVGGFVPKPETGREAPGSFAKSEDSRDSVSEFDLAFPSENPGEAEVRAGPAPKRRSVPTLDSTPDQSRPESVRPEAARDHRDRREPGTMVAAEGAGQAAAIEGREFGDKQVIPPPGALDYDNVQSSRNVRGSAFGNSMLGNSLMFDRVPGLDPFADLGYGSGGSDGWHRRNWLAVVMIVLAIFVGGGVLAIGPSNVKAIAVRKLSVLVKAPPLQTNADANAAAQSTPPAIPPAGNRELPPASSSAQSSAPSEIPAEKAADASDQDAKAADEESSPRAAERVPLTKANPAIRSESSDDAESAEEITRKFQLEHRDTPIEAIHLPVSKINPGPASNEAEATGVPVKRRLPPNSDEPGVRQSSQTSSTMPTGMPTGLVSISSHFESVQGIAADQLADNGRPTIGQLVSIKQPVYTAEAVREHVEGTVRLRVVVDQIGHVEAVYVLSGPPLLVPSAIRAVREWRYDETVLNSKAVKSVEDVAMVFRMASSLESPRD